MVRFAVGMWERTDGLLCTNTTALDGIEHDGVVARDRGLVRMAEVHSAVLEIRAYCPSARNDDEWTALSHPDGMLMCSLEAMDRCVAIIVGRDRTAIEARLGDPARHGEGRSSRGDHASRPIGRVSTVTYESKIGSIWNFK